jgi:hypothetical protein
MVSPTTVEKAKAELSLRTPKKDPVTMRSTVSARRHQGKISFLSAIRYIRAIRRDSGLLEQTDQPAPGFGADLNG